MLSLGALSFAAPWALAALAALPALWWLLRITPPSPLRIVFPPLRLLATLSSRDESSMRTPWWLLALRLGLALALILGVARPVLNAGGELSGSGPVYLVIDDGWAAAGGWVQRQAALTRIIDRAERESRSVVLMPTAPTAGETTAPEAVLLPAGKARELAQALRPKPWSTDRPASIAAMLRQANAAGWPPGAVVWISDGIAEPKGAEEFPALLERLRALGQITLLEPPPTRLPMLLKPADPGPGGEELTLVRTNAEGEMAVTLRMVGEDQVPLALQPARFAGGDRRLRVPLDLPTELSGRLARVEIEGREGVGTVLLTDERWQRRAVGLFGAAASEQPLLGPDYYLQRALEPFAEVRQGDLDQLLSRPLAALVLTDVGTPDAATAENIRQWVEKGGVLLRFAGPRLAREASLDDPLLPVALRAGERTIGGALSWSGAGKLAPFDPNSPFHGLVVPLDLEFHRQVIAEPSLDVADRTWARLDDGTPLITGVRRGNGWIVLMHATATPDWSNLPLSGLFVDLLRRIVGLSTGGQGRVDAPVLPPLVTLDGFGRLGAPPPGTRAIVGGEFGRTVVAPAHPPGFYGTAEAKRALNLGPSVAEPAPLGALPAWVRAATLGESAERDLRPWLLGAALLLALLDLAVSLALRGLLRMRPEAAGRKASAGALALLLVLGLAGGASAQTVIADGTAEKSSLATRLAYVRSGDSRVDEVTEAGLVGLSSIINRRTAAELGEPVGVDPERDELVFYPMLYWPLAEANRPLSHAAARKLAAYMRSGGTIVFDTRGGSDSADRAALRELARTLDLPPLVPVPEDHVLRRSYYLLPDLPGRRTGGTVWIERSGEHVNDGVSSVVAGSNDWAGAWAADTAQRPLFAVVPGGERQRELAYRFGVNLVMYVLTGNYKADQVHLPTIIERLGP